MKSAESPPAQAISELRITPKEERVNGGAAPPLAFRTQPADGELEVRRVWQCVTGTAHVAYDLTAAYNGAFLM